VPRRGRPGRRLERRLRRAGGRAGCLRGQGGRAAGLGPAGEPPGLRAHSVPRPPRRRPQGRRDRGRRGGLGQHRHVRGAAGPPDGGARDRGLQEAQGLAQGHGRRRGGRPRVRGRGGLGPHRRRDGGRRGRRARLRDRPIVDRAAGPRRQARGLRRAHGRGRAPGREGHLLEGDLDHRDHRGNEVRAPAAAPHRGLARPERARLARPRPGRRAQGPGGAVLRGQGRPRDARRAAPRRQSF